MKQLSSVITGLKFVLKYGAILGVLVKIITFSIDELEKLDLPKPEKENV